MFKLNSFCKECFDPHKIVWNCKKHTDDKEWFIFVIIVSVISNILMAENLNPNFRILKVLDGAS